MVRTYTLHTAYNGHSVTRWDLARQVIACYTRFWEVRSGHVSALQGTRLQSTQEARRANVSPDNEHWADRRFDFDELVLVSISNCEGHDAVFQAVVEVPRR